MNSERRESPELRKRMERSAVQHSVDDVIKILEDQAVRPDLAPGWTEVQVMNRVSIAHLSIERAMKFTITEAGGPLVKDHDLPSRLEELRQYEPESAKFLEEAFEDAVRHYRYNANATHMKHLKSLETYLKDTGTDNHFQDIRYWELTQSANELILRTIYLTLHMELLHAVREILLAPERPKDTVSERVENAVREAMFHNRELDFIIGSDKERSVESYIKWLEEFGNLRDAMAEAFAEGLKSDDSFMLKILREAYKELTESSDPAVRYFAETLTVLPKQQRNAVPCVEWLGPETHQAGIVSTPGGDRLGHIHRRSDRLWNITPSRGGVGTTTPIAQSQTDARCYLADLLTRTARVVVGDEERELRIVGDEHNLYKTDHKQVMRWWEDMAKGEKPTFQVNFWDSTHGITTGDVVKLETLRRNYEGVSEILEGTVTEVRGHEASVQGKRYFGKSSETSPFTPQC